MVLVPPAAITKMTDQAAVGPPTALASPSRTAKADDGRELGLGDRIEPAMLATDRYRPCNLLAEPVQPTARDERAKINTPPQPPKAPCTIFLRRSRAEPQQHIGP